MNSSSSGSRLLRTPAQDARKLNAVLSGLALALFLAANADAIGAQDASSTLEEVRIGTQVWSVMNLDVTHFRNGDPIPEAKTDEEWRSAWANGMPAWTYYEGNPDFGTGEGMSSSESRARGKLYNWLAVSDRRGLAPEGWHVPSFAEWETLTILLGGAGGVAENAMMVPMGQAVPVGGRRRRGGRGGGGTPSRGGAPPDAAPQQNGGTNSSGFTALPGGSRGSNGRFTGYGAYGYWWSSTSYDVLPMVPATLAWYRMLLFLPGLRTVGDVFTSPTLPVGGGLSVRVVKN